MPCQSGYPDGMSPLGRMIFTILLWETFHQDIHTDMAYLYNISLNIWKKDCSLNMKNINYLSPWTRRGFSAPLGPRILPYQRYFEYFGVLFKIKHVNIESSRINTPFWDIFIQNLLRTCDFWENFKTKLCCRAGAPNFTQIHFKLLVNTTSQTVLIVTLVAIH